MRARSRWLILAALGLAPGASCSARSQGVGANAAEPSAPVASSPSEGQAAEPAPAEATPPTEEVAAPTEASAAADSAPPEHPAGPRIFSQAYVTWIYPTPFVKEGRYLGYVRVGSSVALRSEEKVAGVGCANGFYQVEPRGYVCDNRTVTRELKKAFGAAARAASPTTGPFPYRYAISNGAPMYNRVPTAAEQDRLEKWLGPAGSHLELPMFSRSHEELAVDKTIEARDPIPWFFEGGASPRQPPFDLVNQTIPLGSMLSFTKSFEAEGRTWLLSADHTIVPADRVRPFRPSTFQGVELTGDTKLPLAFMRKTDKPKYVSSKGEIALLGESWPVRTHVLLTGERRTEGGKEYLLTREKNDGRDVWIAADDATVIEPAQQRALGIKEGMKWFDISVSQGTLVAYEDLTPVFATLVSPGSGGVSVKGQDNVKYSTTPRGTYYITFKDKAATMSPETGKNRSFWIQDVPHTQYFNPPFALHGAYWHERFGEYVSAGCVNLSPLDAERMFAWSDPPVPKDWQGAAGAGAPENGPVSAVHVRR